MNKEFKLELISGTKPFLRWAGGKQWFVKHFFSLYSNIMYTRYYEPFLGGGAFFFSFDIKNATLSDTNGELINTYIQVRDNPLSIIKELRALKNNELTYNVIKKIRYRSSVKRAARFLFLNRTSFAGIYRVNKKGEYNVPYGGGDKSHEILWDNDLLINASARLKKIKILQSDFEAIIEKTKTGDVVYCDPIYTVSHNDNCFKKYNERIFSWEDQVRLCECSKKAAKRGVKIIISNAYHRDIKALYKNFTLHKLERYSGLCPETQKRKMIYEYVAVSKN